MQKHVLHHDLFFFVKEHVIFITQVACFIHYSTISSGINTTLANQTNQVYIKKVNNKKSSISRGLDSNVCK